MYVFLFVLVHIYIYINISLTVTVTVSVSVSAFCGLLKKPVGFLGFWKYALKTGHGKPCPGDRCFI